jgi:rubrerythrin
VKHSSLHSVSKAQTDLFSSLAVLLPNPQELAHRYAEFNLGYFENQLPAVTIRWSKRMRIAGTCDSHRRIITLSHIYHTQFPDDVDDTLKHEMIHLRCPRHDAAFRREAARIGASVHCRDYPDLHPRARYIYFCPNCGTEFPRSKRAHLYCGACGRRGFDPRFRLILRTNAAHERAVRSLAAKSPAHRRASGVRRRRNDGELTGNLF